MLFAKISNICKERGISIARLEREVCLGNATIRGWEKSSPNIGNLKRVADYFGLSVDELLSEDHNADKEGGICND